MFLFPTVSLHSAIMHATEVSGVQQEDLITCGVICSHTPGRPELPIGEKQHKTTILEGRISMRAPPLRHLRRVLRRALGRIPTANKTGNTLSLYTLFFAHSTPLQCAIGPLSTFFPPKPHPFYPCVCVWGRSLSYMDGPLSGRRHVLVLVPN